MNRHHRIGAAVFVAVFTSGFFASCAEPEAAAQETTSSQAAALNGCGPRVGVGPRAIAYDYYPSLHLPHGVAGDEDFVFVAQALDGQVMVLERSSGDELGVLPPPPGGWLLPFAVRVPSSNKVAILDAGGFPNPNVPSIARIYEYEFHKTGHQGCGNGHRNGRGNGHDDDGFTATLTRTISFAGLPLVYAEDFEPMPGGGYVLSESVIGALWVVAPNGAIAPGIMPDNLAVPVAAIGPCGFSPTVISGVPFSSAGNFAPGVGSLAIRAGNLYFGSSCRGGVQKVPVATLTDVSRTPEQRAADITTVSARPANVVVESLKGFAFNRWSNDDHLIVTDAFNHRLLRVDIHTGAREVLVDDEALFDFPTAAQFLPPAQGSTPLVVTSDQEYRLAALNPLIPQDLIHPPFIVAKVVTR